MIKFEFTVSDVEAETIMSCISDRINRNHEEIMNEMVEKHEDPSKETECDARIKWYRANTEYLKDLKLKMKNTYVEG
jgi:hypothetical protein